MAPHHRRLSRGFLTLWALGFLVVVSTLLMIVLAGQLARIRTTDELLARYQRPVNPQQSPVKPVTPNAPSS
ncbi:hypothetical protein [Levilactobacillus suantsaii]|uniref:Uncharacterized protein n=1 Tax=Levilactobacillus suantsaii TaxID=2292255 RepID=A0A4Q0VLF0_9LACO|nr:hypothetical protein [Levilactobacillus suantsaii]QMU07870.1 hypothetical protein H3M12_10575 [Levilactobacillus suantsaii]RXI79751.1 hypothetical protein DXH47_01040 [Levilactobacillus suantsaii]